MPADSTTDGPVLFAYDGSEHAKAAIEQAGRQLRTGRAALVLTVWQPLQSIPFAQLAVVPDEVAEAMGEEARKTAAEGVELARAAGFDAEPLVEVGAPVWARIVQVADEQDAAVVVLGSHGRSGLSYAAMGSVATAVAHHVRRPVMISRIAG
jgi:nucleotide-binding universal stress UspA family protein